MTESSDTARFAAHFVGIGGAGMSGIARVMAERGDSVRGSDLRQSRYTEALTLLGVDICIGHEATNVGDAGVIVVSSAIRPENPELAEARKRGIEIWPRAKMLAALAGDRTTIAVAGTHGKTSTSAMVATMLAAMELDPTFVVGGEVSAFATNARNGSGAHYVVEADESDGSFMYMDPGVAIVTNVEADHLDHYGSLDAVERTFVEFMCRVPQDGHLVLCGDDERLLELARDCPARTVTYGFATDVDVRCRITGGVGLGHRFEVVLPDGTVHESSIRVPGRHMVQNATAAIATAWALGLDIAAASAALAEFDGVKRRFDMIGEACGISVVDDYAHHPTEVKATLAAARECDYSRVWVVFQPHRYSRTEALAREFGAAFADADRVVLMDVYSAGEAPIPGVSGKTVLDELLEQAPRARAAYLPHRTDVAPYLAGRLRPGDLVLTMGAGDVTTMGIELLRAVAPEVDGAA